MFKIIFLDVLGIKPVREVPANVDFIVPAEDSEITLPPEGGISGATKYIGHTLDPFGPLN